jgi:ATP phosphoribosyltransferase
MNQRTDVRLSLPSKGRLADAAWAFLAACGLAIDKPNPRQYAARIPTLPGLTVLFQRPGDIVVSVRDGSVDFGITGMDVTAEYGGSHHEILVLHDALGFGGCRLAVAVPEAWETVTTMATLAAYTRTLRSSGGAPEGEPRPLRVATKYPNVTEDFLTRAGVAPFELIHAEGTLEVAPAIGYADCIVDLVSSGQTLRDNRLRPLEDGVILRSQAGLIANRRALHRPEVLRIARTLLEYIEAHLRAVNHVLVVANMRGESPQAIAQRMFTQEMLSGLQGPTIAPVVVQDSRAMANDAQHNRVDHPTYAWHAVQVVVPRDRLFQAVTELRAIGGSGVVVTPVTYIFEEEPARYRAMMEALA